MRPVFGQCVRTSLFACLMLCIFSTAFAQDAGSTPSNPQELGGFYVQGFTFDTRAPPPPPPPPIFTFHNEYVTLNQAPAADPKNNKNACDKVGDPILPKQGAKIETYTLFTMPGEMGLTYALYYNSAQARIPATAPWRDNLGYGLDVTCSLTGGNTPCRYVVAFRPDGSTINFNGGPAATTFTQATGSNVVSLTRNTMTGVFTFHDEDGTTSTYDSQGNILTRVDAAGIGWTFSRSGTTKTITHTNGQSISVSSSGSVYTVVDPAGNNYVVKWGNQYEPSAYFGDVASITFPGQPTTVIGFKYSAAESALLSEVDYNGIPYSYTTYFTADSTSPYYLWATGGSLADGSSANNLQYSKDSSGNLQAILTNPLGHQSTRIYGGVNGQLSLISDDSVQTCGATTHGYTYDGYGNLAGTIDNNGSLHTFNYAQNGQLQTETEASGTSNARTTDYVWDSNPQLNRKLSATVENWRKTSYTYTAQNRLASISVTNLAGSGSRNQTLTTNYAYSLYGNGMVSSMTVTSPSPSGSNSETTTYDSHGNATALSNGLGQTTTYSNYNALGQVGHVVGPNGDVIDYTYDARGRLATKTTYPNGSAATWTYSYDGFGLPYTLTGPDGQVTTWNRNPSTMRVDSITHNDKDGASTESFSYDANGDVLEHKIVRGGAVGLDEVFHYDALGRIYQKVGRNGQLVTYAYDGNGNVVSAADAVGHTIAYQYDALNRVTKKTESGGASPLMPSAAPSINAPGNSATGNYTVSWMSITGATTYLLQEQVSGGSWSTVQNNATINWTANGKPSNSYAYRVQGCNATGCGPWSGVVTTIVLLAPSTPSLTVPSSNSSGSYVVSWTSVPTATIYNLQEQVGGGSWTTIQSNGVTSWSASSKANNIYSYQVQACNATGCSAWSAIGSVQVLLPPGSAPVLTVPASNATGSYSVSWTNVSTATSYTLQEQLNGGAWTTVQASASLAWNAAAKSNGTYAYQVQACNGGGCGAWSAAGTTVVLLPPGSPPSVSSPATSGTGNYTVSWSTIPSATSYNLQEQLNGGAWATVQSSAATTWAASGKANGTYKYQAQSCNSGGCSGWSAATTTTVLLPPASAPTVSVPGSNSTGGYSVTWTGVATATLYNLQERVNGGSWTTVQSSSATSWSASGHGNGTYGYQVQACNSSGCGPWSVAGTASVLLPPSGSPSVSVPASSGNGSYTVSWSGVSTATSYNLQEQVNGGGWSTVQSSASSAWSTSGRGNGAYGYHAQACNSSGCGPWSSVASINVLWPPSGAPALSVPSRNYSGSYTVSWSGVSTASSYTLQEQVNGGGWTTVQANGSTSWSTSGHGSATYGYQVIACNASGCGPWSAAVSTLVIIPTPIAINGKGYSVYYGIPARQTGSDSIGFSIVNGNTWEVISNKPGQLGYVAASGTVPSMATSVQFTYTSLGPPPGYTDAGGTLSNAAASPAAINSNPSSLYTTGSFSGATAHGRQYSLKVDFYDSTGTNISSSTCTLIAETGTAQ